MANLATEIFTSARVGTKFAIARRMTVAVGAIGDAAWVGTVKFRWEDKAGNARYVTDEAGTDLALTTNGWAVELDFGAPVKISAEVTAYTSGSIRTSIQAEDYVGG